MECDILIVGAGPAGSSAARAAAEAGADVLVIDRRERIGVPVQCAEYIPAPVIGDVGLGRSYVVQSVRGMRTHLPDGEIKETTQPGFIIDRDRFDQALVQDAIDKGVRVMPGMAADALEDGAVLMRQKNGDRRRVRPTVIIGADGPRSRVAGWMGEESRDLIPGVQVRMALTHPKSRTEVYFDPGLFGGYGWLFPKGTVANVGVAARSRGDHTPSLKSLLMGFVDRLVGDGEIEGDPLSSSAGWIPVLPVEKMVRENIALVGDAAGHAHPITGAGIFTAVAGGAMAGRAAAAAIAAGDMAHLGAYETEFLDVFGSMFERGVERRHALEREWADLGRNIKSCWIAFREYYEA